MKADLRLGDITVVIGPTDSGKSNLVRALATWAFNASGKGFITVGHGVCRIAVSIGPRDVVVFEKTSRGGDRGAQSRYVTIRKGSKISYEKIGLTVPVEVSDLTGLKAVEVDTDVKIKPNFSFQDDGWFLLSGDWSAQRVAKAVGSVSGVDVLILANRDLTLESSRAQGKLKGLQARLAEIEAEIGTLDYLEEDRANLDAAEEALGGAEKAEKALGAARAAIDGLRALVGRQRAVKGFLEAARAAIGQAEQAGGFLEILARSEIAERAWSACVEVQQAVRDRRLSAQGLREELDQAIEDLREVARSDDLTCPICLGPAHKECRDALGDEADAVHAA